MKGINSDIKDRIKTGADLFCKNVLYILKKLSKE